MTVMPRTDEHGLDRFDEWVLEFLVEQLEQHDAVAEFVRERPNLIALLERSLAGQPCSLEGVPGS